LMNSEKIVTYAKNKTKWLNVPYKTENKHNSVLLSRKTIKFDDTTKPEGFIDKGIMKSETVYNSVGTDLTTTFDYESGADYRRTIITKPNGITTENKVKWGVSKTTEVKENDELISTTTTDELNRATKITNKFGDITQFYFGSYTEGGASLTDAYDRLVAITQDGVLIKQFEYPEHANYYSVVVKSRSDISKDLTATAQFIKDKSGMSAQVKNGINIDGKEQQQWVTRGIKRHPDGRIKDEGMLVIGSDTDVYTYEADTMTEKKTSFEYDVRNQVTKVTTPNNYIVNNKYLRYSDTTNSDYLTKITSDNTGKEHIEQMSTDRRIEINKIKSETGYITSEKKKWLNGYSEVREKGAVSADGKRQFDSLGRLTYVENLDSGRQEYKYNNKGQLSEVFQCGDEIKEVGGVRQCENPRKIVYTYDSKSRTKQISYLNKDGNEATENRINYFYYDTDAESECETKFDTNAVLAAECTKYSKGSLKKVKRGTFYGLQYYYGKRWVEEYKRIDGSKFATKYIYNIAGQIKSIIYPDGKAVNYEYDKSTNLKSVKGELDYISDIKYNKNGQRSELTYGNGNVTTYTYNPLTDRLDTMIVMNGGEKLLDYKYYFTKSGMINYIEDRIDTSTQKSLQYYRYDPTGKIAYSYGKYSMGEPNEAKYFRSYDFDDLGRMKHKVLRTEGGQINRVLEFTPQGRSHRVGSVKIYDNNTGSPTSIISDVAIASNMVGDITLDYDRYGNLEYKPSSISGKKGEQHFKYNASNRMSSVHDNIHMTKYRYDSQGNRLSKIYGTYDKVSGGIQDVIKTTLIVNGFYEISNNDKVNKHIYDGNSTIATKRDNDNDKMLYYTPNHIGSRVLFTGSDGKQQGRHLFTPFGENWIKESSDGININFATGAYDSESGLYYLNNRYYDPELGTFTRPDPAMDGLDHYSYVRGNPIMYSDPTGMLILIDDALFWGVQRLLGYTDDDFGVGMMKNFANSWKVVTDSAARPFVDPVIAVKNYIEELSNANSYGDVFLATLRVGATLGWAYARYQYGFDLSFWGFASLYGTLSIGTILAYGAVEIYGAEVVWYEDVQIIYGDHVPGSAASVGGGKVIGKYSGHLENAGTRKHEQGHYYQNMFLGDLYIPVIMIPSFLNQAVFKWYEEDSYYDFFTESWADDWGGSYYDKSANKSVDEKKPRPLTPSGCWGWTDCKDF